MPLDDLNSLHARVADALYKRGAQTQANTDEGNLDDFLAGKDPMDILGNKHNYDSETVPLARVHLAPASDHTLVNVPTPPKVPSPSVLGGKHAARYCAEAANFEHQQQQRKR